MPSIPSIAGELREVSTKELARIKEQFAATGDGKAALLGRTALIESLIERLWKQHVCAEASGPAEFAVVALGGFGRRWLFPFSDIDALFLHAGNGTEEKFKEPIRKFSQDLWDLGLKLSPATRTIAECSRFEAANSEFAISLLDCRHLAGDHRLFARLHDEVIPKLLARESEQIVKRLGELTRTRHGKFGSTVFHLEPNVKDGPGGLRDYNVVCWLSLMAALEQYHVWPSDDAILPVSIQEPFAAALNALVSIRCFLHFRHNRDDNALTWESQDAAAARQIGVAHSPRTMRAASDQLAAEDLSTAEWMRLYFSHARTVHHVCVQMLEEIPAARLSLHHQFQQLRSRLSNAEFLVEDGMLQFRQPAALDDPELILRAFRFLARHGLRLSSGTEAQLERAFPALEAVPPKGTELWHVLQEILVAPHAADAVARDAFAAAADAAVPGIRGN